MNVIFQTAGRKTRSIRDRDAKRLLLWPTSFALLNRQPAQMLAVKFEQVEGTEHGRKVHRPGPEQIEDREPAVVAHNGLAVDQAGDSPAAQPVLR